MNSGSAVNTRLYARSRSAFERLAMPGPPLVTWAWWLVVAAICVVIVVFGNGFLPEKFRFDAFAIADLLEQRDLWEGVSFDGFTNSARVWSVVLAAVPENVFLVLYFLLLLALGTRLLDVDRIASPVAQAMAGSWFVCGAVFLGRPSKEMIALPVATWLCLARSWPARLAATILFLAYAAYFRQYWFIVFFYFAAFLLAFRLRRLERSVVAIVLAGAAIATPFVVAEVLGEPALTDARTSVNAERTDSPDARSSFLNPMENTGAATDLANAAAAWVSLNIPLRLAAGETAHYLAFALFQIATVTFFIRGLARCTRDFCGPATASPARTAVRCAAFVMAYSVTQGIFEPDFGSFLRHQISVMLPLLVVVCYGTRE